MLRKTGYLVQSAAIAAIYIVLTYVVSLFGFAYGPVQFRVSEALTLLPVLTPAAIPGLILGCFVSNLWSPLGVIDIVFGTLATALAAFGTRALRAKRIGKIPVWSALCPVVCNAVIVGLEIAFLSTTNVFSFRNFSWPVFASAGLSVGAGELAVCFLLGIPMVYAFERTGAVKIIFQNR